MRNALRIPCALAFAGLASAVWLTHVFVEFHPIRAKVVQAPIPAVDGIVRVTTAGFPQLKGLRPPFAVIARIKAPSTDSLRIRIAFDGSPTCEHTIAGGASRRVDCAVTSGGETAADREVVVSGPSAPWTLEYLELATHHGNTSGAHTLFVLPGSSTGYVRPGLGWSVAFWAVLAGLLLVPPSRSTIRWLRVAFKVLAALIVVLLAVIQCSESVSDYRVVLAGGSFALWLAVLLAPRLWAAGRWLVRRVNEPGSRRMALVRAGLAGALVLAVFLGLVSARLRDSYSGNYSGFLVISRTAFDTHPTLKGRADVRRTLVLQENGYDGQFMYFATYDPFLREYKDAVSTYGRFMDYAPYRYGRIGTACWPGPSLAAAGNGIRRRWCG